MGIKEFDMPEGGKIIRILSPELEEKEGFEQKYYTVLFSDDFATLQTTVAASGEDDAIDQAIEQISDYYDLDISTWKCDYVEEIGG
jgi:hypothetical protein